jgi:hypothetical protein
MSSKKNHETIDLRFVKFIDEGHPIAAAEHVEDLRFYSTLSAAPIRETGVCVVLLVKQIEYMETICLSLISGRWGRPGFRRSEESQ